MAPATGQTGCIPGIQNRELRCWKQGNPPFGLAIGLQDWLFVFENGGTAADDVRVRAAAAKRPVARKQEAVVNYVETASWLQHAGRDGIEVCEQPAPDMVI